MALSAAITAMGNCKQLESLLQARADLQRIHARINLRFGEVLWEDLMFSLCRSVLAGRRFGDSPAAGNPMLVISCAWKLESWRYNFSA